jgi:microsomal dipeptidase-like Zn-dependent dipeptidase
MGGFIKFLFKLLLIIAIIAVAIFLIFGPAYVEKSRNTVVPHNPFAISAPAQALHNDMIIGDWHSDSLLWKRNLLKRGTRGQVDIPRLQDGNVAIQMFTAVTKSPKGQNYENNSTSASDNITPLAIGQLWPTRTWNSIFERAMYQAQKLHVFAAKAPNDLTIIKTKTDLENHLSARKQGKKTVGALLGIEGAHPLEGNIDNLPKLVEAGYRMIALQHFFDNELGGSLHSFANKGLTGFGRHVVEYVEKNNLILDLAHSSPKVVEDVLKMTNMPIVVSHTGIHSNCKTTRNYPDPLMKRIAAKGGVIGIGYWADVTCDSSPLGVAKTIKAAVDLLGEDAVSLGSDFDGSVETGFDTSELAALTQALMATGLADAQIRKIMGENMIRVLRARLK